MTSRPRPNAGTKGVPRAEREAEILAVAGRSFGERGYAAVSVSEIATQAGISKPLVYNYFGSKEGLFEACLEESGAVIARDVERTAASGAVGLARALVTLEGVFTVLEGQPWIWRLFFDPARPTTARIDEVVARYTNRLTERAIEGVAELLAIAGNDDPLDASALTAVWASVFDSLVTWWLDHPEVTAAEMTQRSTRLFAAILAADPPA